jgi:formylmethanofuran dehydrogenase subunit E
MKRNKKTNFSKAYVQSAKKDKLVKEVQRLNEELIKKPAVIAGEKCFWCGNVSEGVTYNLVDEGILCSGCLQKISRRTT